MKRNRGTTMHHYRQIEREDELRSNNLKKKEKEFFVLFNNN